MNNKIQIVKQHTISFKRIDTKSCTHYQIYAKADGVEFLLDTIENPKTSVDFSRVKFLEYNKNKVWEFEEEVLAKTSSDIAVYVNDVRLNTGQYTFNSNLRVLNVHIDIKPTSSIRVEYSVDRIKYIHTTDRKYEYRIAPVFLSNYRIGQHSYLNYK